MAFQLLNGLGLEKSGVRQGQHFVQQLRGNDPFGLQAVYAFKNQRQRRDRACEQRPDRPTGRLYDA